MKPQILARETVYTGYLTVDRLQVQLADGAWVWLEVERHGDAVVVLPYDADRRCALVVRLFRAPVFDTTGGEVLEEACAGMIGNEEVTSRAPRLAVAGEKSNEEIFGDLLSWNADGRAAGRNAFRGYGV